MNPSIEKLGNEINRIRSTATERSFYPLLCDFIRDFETETFKKRKELNPIIEEARRESQIGFPDITVRHGSALIGWIEIKLPKDSLANEKFSEQFSKYRNSLENVLFTNLREWELWQWDEKGQSRKVAECLFDPAHFALKEERHLENIIIRFLEGKAYPAKTPKQLAFALARKTRLLSQQVEEAFDEKDKESELYRLREAFQTTLIQNISVHQFSNMVAETLAYSLFLAFLEHAHREEKTELTLTSAIDYLPTNVPILADLYSLVSKVSQKIHVIQSAVTVLIEQLKEADIARIYQKLVDHKPGEDPVVQFYEPFLKEYDPKEREARGVYYTPKPVVDFIVRGVDYLLRTKFNKEDGLGDKTVQILDPATGTGTFLMSAIQQIHEDAKQKYAKLGEPMLRKAFDDIVLNHILKHFFGFELLVAPYAIAHLKLTLLLEKLGFDFDSTKGDNDPDNDRLKIYLANALDDPDKPPMTLFGFESIPEESEKARKVKKEAPIIVVMGNPPYSGQSANVSYKLEGKKKVPNFIGKLIRDYYFVDGKPLKERNPKWLQDDYVKFIRFAQWKIEQTGSGVLAFITNHGYLDNPTFRGMRQKLMNAFSEIYILDLHGNIKKGEKCPDGSKDEPVFQIQQGTCIGFFIKNKKAENTAATIKHSDLWGLRRAKFSVLLEKSLEGYSWNNLTPVSPFYYFVPQDLGLLSEYQKGIKITDIFHLNSVGIATARDEFTIKWSKDEVWKTVDTFSRLPEEEARSQFTLGRDVKDWKVYDAQSDVRISGPTKSHIQPVLYRPFDIRYTYYTGNSRGFHCRPRPALMKNMLGQKNIGIITSRLTKGEKFAHVQITKNICEVICMSPKTSNNGFLFPLYIYDFDQKGDVNSQSTFEFGDGSHGKKRSNLHQEFTKNVQHLTSFKYIDISRGDLETTVGHEDVFAYIFAILHSVGYRNRYQEFLCRDYPCIPFTKVKEPFRRLAQFGYKLINLQLFGENPLDKTAEFLPSGSWNITAGGEKPTNVSDWQVTDVSYHQKEKRIYVNQGQYFEGVELGTWNHMVGGYQVCEKWLKDRKKAGRSLSKDDLLHYMKIVVAIRETIRIMGEIDQTIEEHGGWPLS